MTRPKPCTKALTKSSLERATKTHKLAHVQLGLNRACRRRSKAEESYILSQRVLAECTCSEESAATALGLGHVYRLRADYIKAQAPYSEAGAIFSEGAESRAEWLLGLVATRESQKRNDEAEHLLGEVSSIFCKLLEDRVYRALMQSLTLSTS